jgi:hypothetical protein
MGISPHTTFTSVSGDFKAPRTPFGIYSAGTYANGTDWVIDAGESRETMTDVIGQSTEHHPVTHARKHVAKVEFAPPVYKYTNPAYPFGVCEVNCASKLPLHLLEPTLMAHCAMSDGTLVARARVPSLNKRQVDGLVELYELKDIVHMLGQIAALLMSARFDQQRYYGDKRTRSLKRNILDEFASSPSHFLATLVGGHLGYKFAVAPLAKLVRSVNDSLKSLDKRMKQLKETSFAVHGSYTAEFTEISVGDWQPEPSTMGFFQSRITTSKSTTATWTESALRRLIPNKLPDPGALAKELLVESLGLTPGLKAIWDVIPRSFIFGWFFPIGDFLAQLDGSSPQSQWFQTLNTYSSFKADTTGTVLEEFAPLESSYTSVELSGLDTCRADFSYHTYTRSELLGPLWTPAQPFVPRPRIPTIGQWSTVAEMIFQGGYQAFKVKGPSLVNQL